MSGWIKLHRSIQDHFIYDFSEPDKALAWVDILLSASYADSKVKIKSSVILVRKGQWLVSQVTLQKRWKMSQNKVKRLLLMLKNDGMIDLETNELTSIITICNFSNYQDNERAGEQPHGRAGERATDEQANDILRSKELKEGKEVKKRDISQQAGAFTPPSPNDVDSYMGSICKGSYLEAEKFVDFYASKGWMVGKNKMKDWKAAVRNWTKNETQSAKKGFDVNHAKNIIGDFLND